VIVLAGSEVRTVAGQFSLNAEVRDGKMDLEVASVMADLSMCTCVMTSYQSKSNKKNTLLLFL
jgi:hypothetical protein